MAAKRKPAITGLHSQGIIDDIIVPVARRVLKGGAKNKAMKKIAASQYKKADKAEKKLEKIAISEIEKSKNRYKTPDALITSRNIRKQWKKHYAHSAVGNAVIGGKPTRGVAKLEKKYAPKYITKREYGRNAR